jgi:hypothetical protein
MKNLRKILKKLLNNYWPILATSFLVILFFWKFFIRGLIPIPGDFIVGVYHPWLDYKWGTVTGVPVKNPIMADVVSFTYPMRILAVEQLKSGTSPLWNPYILTGTPLLANFQSAPFTFTNIFYFVFNNNTAWGLQVASQHFFVILFTFLLLRYWKLSKTASLVGGIIYSFSGFNMIWSQWNAHTLTASFIPLLILFLDKFLTTGNKKHGVMFSLVLFLQLLSGYPQVVLYTIIALALFWITKINKTKKIILGTFFLILFGLLGIGLAAFQLLPGAELLSASQRSIEINTYSYAVLPWVKLITFLAPDFFGNHATGNYWGPQDYTSNVGFVGVVAMILFFIPLGKKISVNLKFAYLLSVLAIIMAIDTPVTKYIWASGFLGLKAASAHRVLILWNFAVAICAAYGLDHIFAKNKISKKSLIFAGLCLSVYLVFAVMAYIKTYGDPLYLLPNGQHKYLIGVRNLVLPSIIFFLMSLLVFIGERFINVKKYIGICISFLLVIELFRFGWKYTPFSPKDYLYPETPVITYLKNQNPPFRVTGTEVIPMNLRMTYGLESPEGYDAVYPQQIAQLFASVGSASANATTAGRYGFIDDVNSPVVGLINTKYLLALKRDVDNRPSETGIIDKKYLTSQYSEVFTDKSVTVLRDEKMSPRAFMYFDYKVEKDRKTLEGLLTNKDLTKTVYLDKDPNIIPVKSEFEAVYRMFNENNIIVDLKTGGDGILFVSDNYYPGWNVYVDGNKKEMLRANYTFRGVSVEKGKHKVEFKYEPVSYKNGLRISFGSGLTLLIIGIASFLVEKNKSHKYT